MQIKKNIPLAKYTTFKIGGAAKYFCEVKNQLEALEAYEFAETNKLSVFVLAGGSNVLINDRGFDGLVIKISGFGIEIIRDNEREVILKVSAGHNWDDLVSFAVTNGWWGIENLSHIPGSTGAIAVQNVGAYGQEASQILCSVTVFDRTTKQILELTNKQCGFGYRSSIFNSSDKNKYLIFYVTLRLNKLGRPNLSYKDLKSSIKVAKAINSKVRPREQIKIIREEIIRIRDEKFPYPSRPKNGNAGSFFRGPVITEKAMEKLKKQLTEIFGLHVASRLNFMGPALKVAQGFKTPAAFLIDICGLKGFVVGGAAINASQPAIVLNFSGHATASDVLKLAKSVRKKVYVMTGVLLNFEPEFVGFSPNELKSLEV